MDLTWLIWVLVAYLCGAISFALLIGKIKGVDIRTVGSGNVGASNVGRTFGRKWGFLCFFLDVSKGALPTLIAGLVLGYVSNPHLPAVDAWKWLAIGTAAIVGHMFPFWLKFKGGKGVATGLGVMLGIFPFLTWPGVAAFVIWILLTVALRYISLSSMAAAVSLPILVSIMIAADDRYTLQQRYPFLIVTGLLALMVVVKHRTNIIRLLAGTETKVGKKAK
jgi:glycerol-3-phosphate acyltransferase PlsY